jgi:hypothetical protein
LQFLSDRKCQAVAVFNTNTHVIVICWFSTQTTVLAEHQKAKPNPIIVLEANRWTGWTYGTSGPGWGKPFENRLFLSIFEVESYPK